MTLMWTDRVILPLGMVRSSRMSLYPAEKVIAGYFAEGNPSRCYPWLDFNARVQDRPASDTYRDSSTWVPWLDQDTQRDYSATQLRSGNRSVPSCWPIHKVGFKREWMGMAPTGEAVEMTAVNLDRVMDGRIVEHGGAANMLEPLLRIGAVKVVGGPCG